MEKRARRQLLQYVFLPWVKKTGQVLEIRNFVAYHLL